MRDTKINWFATFICTLHTPVANSISLQHMPSPMLLAAYVFTNPSDDHI